RNLRPIGIGQCREAPRSEEHTSELQSRFDLVCRLLLEKKKRGGAGRRRNGAHRVLPASRGPRVPQLPPYGPWQRSGQRAFGPARLDTFRPPRVVGGEPP